MRRLLPSASRRTVGPFIFFDHFGPVQLAAGRGLDVRPHPHINLATVTYLFDGEIVHRDSLGTAMSIRPGDVNWMTAGRGIVHSERTAPDHRAGAERLHGLQLWVAMPAGDEEMDPSFHHSNQADLPIVVADGKSVRVIVGSLYGERSPVPTLSDTAYADAMLSPGATLPFDAAIEERAIYIVSGELDIAGDRFAANQMLVFRPGDPIMVTAASAEV